MLNRNKPDKINPDQVTDGRLTILNNLREYLDSAYMNSSQSAHQKKKYSDALKVVDCLRFVKVNETFLRYAFFADKQDASVYSRTQDGKEAVVRDFNGTALDFFIYQNETQYPNQKQALEICIDAYFGLVADFETAIEYVTKNKKLNEFINELQYDETTGCLPKRTARSLKYVEKLKKGFIVFEELMGAFLAGSASSTAKDEEDEQEKIKKALIHFSPYLWKPCLYETENGTQEAVITPDFIVDYMVTIIGYSDPRPKTRHTRNSRFLNTAANEAEAESKSESDGELDAETEAQGSKPEVSYLIKTSMEALKCIAEERALAKNISAPLKPQSGLGANHIDSLSYHINQLTDPANYRPVKTLVSGLDRTQYWDPTDGKGYTRSLTGLRGGAKPPGWKYTKKEAATLVPRNGKIRLYTLSDPVFLLFNVDACYLKRSANTGKLKYVWKANASSNAKGWVGVGNGSRNRSITECSITLEELRDYLRSFEDSDTIPDHNEILACFAKEALNAVGTQNDTLFDRLNALRIRETLRGTLGLQLPILISTPEKGVRVYTRANQLADLRMAGNYSSHSKEAKVLRRLHQDPNKLIELYRQQDVAAKNLVTITQHSEKEALALLLKHREFFMVEEEVEEVKNQALLAAIKNNHTQLALKLIELGAKLDYCESFEKNKKLFWLILEYGNPVLMAAVLEKEQDPETLAQAIFLAAKQNKPALLLQLLKLKPTASLNHWHERGKTALGFAREQDNQELIAALKAAGATESSEKQQLDESKQQSIQTIQAVLLKMADQLEKTKKTAAEAQALQKIQAYLRVLAGELQPEGGFPARLSLGAINELRQLLNEVLNTESFKIYSKDFYASIHACLIALCYWWPLNKAQNGVYLSIAGKPLQNDNRILTSSGLQLDKEEVRQLFAKNSHPLYPNTASPINQRDRSYIAETAGPVYLKKIARWNLAAICGITSLVLYPIVTLILAATLLTGSLAFIALISAAGGGFIPGLLIGLVLAGLNVCFSPDNILKADTPNPKIKLLLQSPARVEEKQESRQAAAFELTAAERKEKKRSVDESRLVRNSAVCLLMPPSLPGSQRVEEGQQQTPRLIN